MKLHTAKKYLSALPAEPQRSVSDSFEVLKKEVFACLGADAPKGVLMAVSGEEYSYVCRVVAATLAYVGSRSAVLSYDISLPIEETVSIDGRPPSDDDFANTLSLIRDCAKKSGCEPTSYEVVLLCGLVLCKKHGIKNIILGFNGAEVSAPLCEIIPLPKIAVILPPQGSFDFIRRGVSEIISAPRREEEYRSASAVCASVNCRHSVIAKGMVDVGATSYRGIDFLYKKELYFADTHSCSMLVFAATAIEAVKALERQGMAVSEKEVAAVLPSVRVNSGCRILSYNPCVILALSGHDEISDQLLEDIKTLCDLSAKTSLVITKDCEKSLFDAYSEVLAQKNDMALCVVGDRAFIENSRKQLWEWLSLFSADQ
jgi:folylpolyglutamate synthase/dihydropteroate synthase